MPEDVLPAGNPPEAIGAASSRRDSLPGGQSGILLVTFTIAIFLNAALLFAVQPMFTKMVLPLLGGTPAIWNTCLLFFQSALLAGYLYAHLTSRIWTPRTQAVVHVILLIAALSLLPLHVPKSWQHPPAGVMPIPWLLGLLSISLGLPFFLLAAGAPMLQRWFATTRHKSAANPYFLYAASNLGSFAALLAYPFLIEPNLPVSVQTTTWLRVYYALLVLVSLCALVAWWTRRSWATGPVAVTTVNATSGETLSPAPALPQGAAAVTSHAPVLPPGDAVLTPPRPPPPEPTIIPNSRWHLRWVLLAFAPSSLLIGTTTYLSTDIASVPFLWVIPLALYLLTFVIVFARRPLLNRTVVLVVQLFLGLTLMVAICIGPEGRITTQAGMHLIAFFVTALMCHRELADSRPRAEYLTEFYLWMSLGGVLGGVFNVILAPLLYNSLVEYPFALVIAMGLRPPSRKPSRFGERWAFVLDVVLPALICAAVWGGFKLPKPPDEWGEHGTELFLAGAALLVALFWRRPFRLALGVGAIYLGTRLADADTTDILLQRRSFFGIYRVRDELGYNVLQNGTTTHGAQSRDPARRLEPITYYGRSGPAGQFFENVDNTVPLRRVAIVGLGTGTTACYGRKGEHWDYYEIDPLAVTIARSSLFTYIRDCPPTVNIVLGDARLSLTQAPDSEYDLIVLDAFSSDAIPIHLLTREAVQMYLRKLKPDGAIAFHISNRYLDLRPVLNAIANNLHVPAALGDRDVTPEEREKLYYGSRWIVMAEKASTIAGLLRLDDWTPLGSEPVTRVWTDDYSDVWDLLRMD